MNRRIKLLLSTLVVMAAIPITNASAYVEMPIYTLSPANGSHLTWPEGNGSTDVVFTSLPEEYYNLIAGIVFEVSTSNALGRDGTLSDDYVFDYDYIHLGDGQPGEYRTRLQHQLYTPGVKYFDFWGYTYQHEFMKSPVFSFTYEPSQISAPAPIAPVAAISKAQAIEDIKALIKTKTGKPSYCRRLLPDQCDLFLQRQLRRQAAELQRSLQRQRLLQRLDALLDRVVQRPSRRWEEGQVEAVAARAARGRRLWPSSWRLP